MVQRFAAANANLIVQVAENKTRTASTVTTAVGVGEEEMGKSRSLRSSSLGSCHQMPQRTMFEKHSGDVAISRYNSSRIGTVASLEDLDLSHSLMPPKRKRRFDNIKAQRLLDRAADWNVLARNLKQGKGVVEIHGHLAEEVVVIVPGQGIGVIEMTMTGGHPSTPFAVVGRYHSVLLAVGQLLLIWREITSKVALQRWDMML